MSGRIVGVVPAAGHATRLQPLPSSKEVLPVGGRPVMDHLVERMRAAGCDELRIVTRPEKRDVIARARELGAVVVEGYPPTVAESLALGMRGLDPGDVVLFGFPDTVWEPADGYAALLERVEAGAEVVLGLFRTPELTRSDVVTVEPPGRVTGVYPKPSEPPSELVWGCLAARAGALLGVEAYDEPGAHLDALAREGRVAAVDFGTAFLDVGTRDAERTR